MTVEATSAGRPIDAAALRPRTSLALRLALRDLRGGVKGFRVFLACLALGVAAVAAVLSISRAVEEGIEAEGKFILGGDASLSIIHRQADAEERAAMEAYGTVSETATMRAMARVDTGPAPVLVEVKGVDGLYPLYGAVELEPAVQLAEALAEQDGQHGVVVAEDLLGRLDLQVGDSVSIGDAAFDVRAVLRTEPDRIAGGLAFGPRAMMSAEGLEASGLVQPGSLVRWIYKIAFPDVTGGQLDQFRADAEDQFEAHGWGVRTSSRATPGVDRFVDRLTLFLSLIGLTALVVGGVGVANATTAYLDQKARVIATLKCLGAPAALIFRVYFIEIMILAALGIAIGLAVGSLMPVALAQTLGEVLPLPARFAIYAEPLAFAAGCGVLTALLFSLWPLGRAMEIAPAALFRDLIDPAATRPRASIFIAIPIVAAGLAALAILGAEDQRFAAIYVGGAVASFVVLLALGRLVMWTMQRVPRPRIPELRLGMANLARPGAATPGVILSLGLGLTLLVMVGLIDANLEQELSSELPDQAPSFFFLDIPRDRSDDFNAVLAETGGVTKIDRTAMLRGHIVALNGVPASEINPTDDAWVLRGDRGLTYAATPPAGTEIVTGEWWPEDYDGPPLVSFAHEPAMGLGVKVGDSITVNVLGRDIQATIASTRDVNWRTMGINFVMIFSPGLIENAPHTYLSTVSMETEGESALLRRVAAEFPSVTSVRVKDALEAVAGLLENLMLGIRTGGLVAIVTGALVLGGAIAAGRRARIYDAVVLKTFGATRWRVMSTYLTEFAVLGLITTIFAIGAGSIAAYFVLTEAMNADFTLIPSVVAWIIALGVGATVAVGFLGTWTALGTKAAPILRSP